MYICLCICIYNSCHIESSHLCSSTSIIMKRMQKIHNNSFWVLYLWRFCIVVTLIWCDATKRITNPSMRTTFVWCICMLCICDANAKYTYHMNNNDNTRTRTRYYVRDNSINMEKRSLCKHLRGCLHIYVYMRETNQLVLITAPFFFVQKFRH